MGHYKHSYVVCMWIIQLSCFVWQRSCRRKTIKQAIKSTRELKITTPAQCDYERNYDGDGSAGGNFVVLLCSILCACLLTSRMSGWRRMHKCAVHNNVITYMYVYVLCRFIHNICRSNANPFVGHFNCRSIKIVKPKQ